eukprot:194293_1
MGNNIPKWNVQKASHLHEHAQRFMLKLLYDELNMGINKNELTDIYNKLMNKQTLLKSNNNNNIDTNTVSTDTYQPCIEYSMADWLKIEPVHIALNEKPIEW